MAQVVAPERFVTGTMRDDYELREPRRSWTSAATGWLERDRRPLGRALVDPSRQDYVRLAPRKRSTRSCSTAGGRCSAAASPRGSVGHVLDQAPCDVAVLVERQDTPTLDADHPVMTPFGGGDHDWAALELAAWISSATGAPLKLLGAAGGNGEGDASGVLQSASLVVNQLAGVTTESVLVDLRNGGILAATEGAGLLVVGLSDRWRDEGLGPVRSEIAKSAEAPTLFVRRGTRPGALAPRAGDVSATPGRACSVCFAPWPWKEPRMSAVLVVTEGPAAGVVRAQLEVVLGREGVSATIAVDSEAPAPSTHR